MKNSFNKKSLLLIIPCIIAVVASLSVPDLLLSKTKENSTNIIAIAPESYYVESGNAMARNASSNLSSLDQIKLISGAWESNESVCGLDQGFLTENEAIQLARYSLDIFYDLGVFPYSSSSNYNNWCSWDAKLYCYTDSLFNTYSAYLWVISFTRFDNSVTHTIYMTENGVILGANTTDTHYRANNIMSAYTDLYVKDIFSDENITLIKKEVAPEGTVIKPVYPEATFSDVSFDQIYIIDLVSSDGALESYYVYQYSSDEIYGIGIAPYTGN